MKVFGGYKGRHQFSLPTCKVKKIKDSEGNEVIMSKGARVKLIGLRYVEREFNLVVRDRDVKLRGDRWIAKVTRLTASTAQATIRREIQWSG